MRREDLTSDRPTEHPQYIRSTTVSYPWHTLVRTFIYVYIHVLYTHILRLWALVIDVKSSATNEIQSAEND